MTNHNSPARSRREARYLVSPAHAPWAWIQLESQESWVPVRLVDISCHGLRMEIPHQPAVDSTIPVRLAPQGPVEQQEVDLRVRWSQMSVRGQWWVGGEIKPPLSKQTIDRLAQAGYLERRKQPRYPVQQPVDVKWELADAWQKAELCDYSTEGFQIRIRTDSAPPTDRILVRVPSASDRRAEAEIAAKIMWQLDSGEHRALGCVFLHFQHFAELRQALGQPATRNAVETPDTSQRRRRQVLAAAVVLTAALYAMLWLW